MWLAVAPATPGPIHPRGCSAFVLYPDRASASRAEWAIKQLPRERKLAFLLRGPRRHDGNLSPHDR